MVRETSMRVGSQLSRTAPAPTGIADLSLRTPGDQALTSAILTAVRSMPQPRISRRSSPCSTARSALTCAPVPENFGIDFFRKSTRGTRDDVRWRPLAATEIVPFWSYVVGGARQIVPVLYTDGTLPLPLFRTQDLGTQDGPTGGGAKPPLVRSVKSSLADRWTLAAVCSFSGTRSGGLRPI